MDDGVPVVDLGELRRDYDTGGLDPATLHPNPVVQFQRWLAEAVAAGLTDPNAMVLATASGDGEPSARTVLLKAVDGRGFVFYTNRGSHKGRDLNANPRAALVFAWLAVRRQVVVRGSVQEVSDADADAYFSSRPRGSQLAAWASRQSEVVPDRSSLEQAMADAAERFGEGAIPRPPWWGGFRVVPEVIELWQGRADRLHDRVEYRRSGANWMSRRLAP